MPRFEVELREPDALGPRHGLDVEPGVEVIHERVERLAARDLPGLVVEAFYHVRFGGEALDNPRAEAVEQALCQLEQLDGRN